MVIFRTTFIITFIFLSLFDHSISAASEGSYFNKDIEEVSMSLLGLLTTEGASKWYDQETTDEQKLRKEITIWARDAVNKMEYKPANTREKKEFNKAVNDIIEVGVETFVELNSRALAEKREHAISEMRVGRMIILVPLPEGFMPANDMKMPNAYYAFYQKQKHILCNINAVMDDSITADDFMSMNDIAIQHLPLPPPNVMQKKILQNDRQLFSESFLRKEKSGTFTYVAKCRFLVDGKLISFSMQRFNIQDNTQIEDTHNELLRWRSAILEANAK